jgi:HEAT repeat protein
MLTLNYTIAFFKQMESTQLAAVAAMGIMTVIYLIFLILTIARRIYNAHKYRVLDTLKAKWIIELNEYINNKHTTNYLKLLQVRPGSRDWVALESSLFSLAEDETYRAIACQLFDTLKYVDYYLKRLGSHRITTRASAIAKLGKMECHRSAQALISMLNFPNHEIIAVTVRALAKAGDTSALLTFMDRLPELVKKGLVAQKTIDSSLVAAGPRITPILLEFGKRCNDPVLIASILSALSVLPVNKKVYDYAVSRVHHPDPEVRAKSLKVIMPCEEELGISHEAAVSPLLNDPVWFVRLQAVRTLGNRRKREYAPEISSLVLDQKWQVRNAAAMSLTLLGEEAIDALLPLLQSKDRYAGMSICEEIEKTGFIDLLLDWLGKPQDPNIPKIKEILSIMAVHGFSSPLKDFVLTTGDQKRAYEIKFILEEAAHKEPLGKQEVPISIGAGI